MLKRRITPCEWCEQGDLHQDKEMNKMQREINNIGYRIEREVRETIGELFAYRDVANDLDKKRLDAVIERIWDHLNHFEDDVLPSYFKEWDIFRDEELEAKYPNADV
jgi:hypothetical protein